MKQGVRQQRGQGIGSIRRRVLLDTSIPLNWESCLRVDANKEELFTYLAACTEHMKTGEKVIIGTLSECVVASGQNHCEGLI